MKDTMQRMAYAVKQPRRHGCHPHDAVQALPPNGCAATHKTAPLQREPRGEDVEKVIVIIRQPARRRAAAPPSPKPGSECSSSCLALPRRVGVCGWGCFVWLCVVFACKEESRHRLLCLPPGLIFTLVASHSRALPPLPYTSPTQAAATATRVPGGGAAAAMAEEAKTVGMDEDRPAPGGRWRERGGWGRVGGERTKLACGGVCVCVSSLLALYTLTLPGFGLCMRLMGAC